MINETSDERIRSALRALADEDRELKPAPALEIRVIEGFRRKRRARACRNGAIWTSAAAAILVAMWFGGKAGKNAGLQAKLPAPQVIEKTVEVPVATETAAKRARVRRVQPREVVTDFFPLMDVAPPFESGELLRVNLAAGAMRVIGIPVDEDHLSDRIQADVLVGQEGLPRAIRFVKTVQ